MTKLSEKAIVFPLTTNDPIVLGRLNVPDPSSGPVYPANNLLFTNEPTETLPTSPTVPAPPPIKILLPDTIPATLSDLSAGILTASPVPMIVMFDLRSPEIAGAVLVLAFPLISIDPTLGAAMLPTPTLMAVRLLRGAPVIAMS